MALQIFKQDNSLYAVYSSERETIVAWDCTDAEIVELLVQAAADEARLHARQLLAHIASGNPDRVYGRRAMSWNEAQLRDGAKGGDYTAALARPQEDR